jgi:Transposase DDE domain
MFRRRCWRRRSSQGAISNDKDPPGGETKHLDREGLGRSRGGLSTKLHIVADLRCRPVARVTTAGQRHDSLSFDAVMNDLLVVRPNGPARRRPDRVMADKAYSSRRIRASLRRRRIKATIPEPADQQAARARRGSRGGRPPAFDPVRYKDRNVVERAINKLRANRAVANRTDKREYMYRGTIDVATIRIWLRDPVQHDSRDTP